MMLEVRKLTLDYRGFEAVRDISFSLDAGQWLMLAGPNGAGKSSLLKAIAKAAPFEGQVLLDGQDTALMNARQMARKMAVLHQSHALGYSYTVEQLVCLGRYAHQHAFTHADPGGRAKVDEALALCGLEAIRHQNALTLSGGELQRAYLAQVLAQDTRLLLLDEPASHLDLAYQQSIFDTIAAWLRTPGRAVLSVVHDLQLARRYGSHALLMKAGQQAAFGPVGEVFSDETLHAVWGMPVADWFETLYAPWRMDKKG